jgi:hypothetical protein
VTKRDLHVKDVSYYHIGLRFLWRADVLISLKGCKTGRICDGYDGPPSTTAHSPSLTLTRIANSSATSQEVRALQFFVERTAVQFGTFVPDDLWSSRVLQLAHSNTCIRHALVALSSYHERYCSRDVGGETPYCLRQYNLAISELVKSGAERPSYLHIQLVSCTIFICIEVGIAPHFGRRII